MNTISNDPEIISQTNLIKIDENDKNITLPKTEETMPDQDQNTTRKLQSEKT